MKPESTAQLIMAMLKHGVKSLSPNTLSVLQEVRQTMSDPELLNSLPDEELRIAMMYITALGAVINFGSMHTEGVIMKFQQLVEGTAKP